MHTDTQLPPHPADEASAPRDPAGNPHRIDGPVDHVAEDAVLGAAIASAPARKIAMGELAHGDFSRPAYDIAFTITMQLTADQFDVTPETIAEALPADALERLGGVDALRRLAAEAKPTRVRTAAGRVHQLARRRRTIQAARDLAVTAKADDAAPDALDKARKSLDRAMADTTGLPAWLQPQDLTPTIEGLLDGTIEVPTPSILKRADGHAIIYPGGLSHGFFGPSESCKTMALQLAAKQMVEAGQTVAVVDFEEADNVGWSKRMSLELGLTAEQLAAHFIYIRPTDHITRPQMAHLIELLTGRGAALVIIDGVNASMSLAQLDPNDNGDANVWYGAYERPVNEAGISTVTIDHEGKGALSTNKFAIGAQSKLAMKSGSVVKFKVKTQPSKWNDGEIEMYITKDRPGSVRVGKERHVGTLHVKPDGEGGIGLAITAPQGDEDRVFYPTWYMERISEVLAGHGGTAPVGTVKDAFGPDGEHGRNGKSKAPKFILDAIGCLVDEGYVRREKDATDRRKTNLVQVRPFVVTEDPKAIEIERRKVETGQVLTADNLPI